MTQSMTRAMLLEHYKATRARLGDTRTPDRPIIPVDRIKPPEPDQTPKPDQSDRLHPKFRPHGAPVLKPLPAPAPAVRQPAPAPAPVEFPPPKPNARRYVHVLHEVATRHGMPVEALIGRSRNMRYVEARQEAFYYLKQAGYSFPQIGQFCNRDHTTVLYGVKKFEEKLKSESEKS